MQPQLQPVEVEFIVLDDYDLAVKHTASRQSRPQRVQQLREIAVERLFVAALDEDLVSITKDQGTKSVPLGLENPVISRGQLLNTLGEHRQQRRVYGKVHISWYQGRVAAAPAYPNASRLKEACNHTLFRWSRRTAQLVHDLDFALPVRCSVRMKNFVKPHRRLLHNIGALPGVPRQVRLSLASDEPPINRAHVMLLGDGQDHVEGAAYRARHEFRTDNRPPIAFECLHVPFEIFRPGIVMEGNRSEEHTSELQS